MGSLCSSRCSRSRNKHQSSSNEGYSSYRPEPYKQSTCSSYSQPYKSYSDSIFGFSRHDTAINSASTYSSDKNYCSFSSHNNHHDTYSSNHDCGSNDF